MGLSDKTNSVCGATKYVTSKHRAGLLNLVIDQGADFELPIIYKKDEVPVNITGCQVKAQFRPSYNSEELVFEASTQNGFITLVPEEGVINFTLPNSVTTTPSKNEGVWDMYIYFPDNKKIKLLQGSFKLNWSVTKDE